MFSQVCHPSCSAPVMQFLIQVRKSLGDTGQDTQHLQVVYQLVYMYQYCYIPVDTVPTAVTDVLVPIITKLVKILAPTPCGKLAPRSLNESGSQQHARVSLNSEYTKSCLHACANLQILIRIYTVVSVKNHSKSRDKYIKPINNCFANGDGHLKYIKLQTYITNTPVAHFRRTLCSLQC